MIEDHGPQSCSEELRRRAVDLFESTPGATLRAIAADLGIVRGTSSEWARLHGTGRRTAAAGSTVPDEVGASRTGRREVDDGGVPLTPEQPIAQLDARTLGCAP